MIRLTIPAPDVPLTANQRLHFRRVAEATRNWRLRTALLARGVARDHGPLSRAHVTYYVSHGDAHNRRRDAGNWYPTVKAALDGCRDSGLISDDDDRHVVGPDPRLGPVADGFVLTLVLDPDCRCADCRDAFGGAA